MHPFPHRYIVNATIRPVGDVPLSTEGVRIIESAPPKEFDGPGNHWSPEGLLDRLEGKMRFTRFDTHAKLLVPGGADIERAKKLLEKAEQTCLIANSLNAERHL